MQAMGPVGLEFIRYAVYEAIKVPYVEFGSHSLEKIIKTLASKR